VCRDRNLRVFNSLGGFRAGNDQRAVRRVSYATRCGSLVGKNGRIPGRAAISDEQDLVIAAPCSATRGIAVRSDRSKGCSRRPRRPCGADTPCWTGGTWISLRAFKCLAAARKASSHRDCGYYVKQPHAQPPLLDTVRARTVPESKPSSEQASLRGSCDGQASRANLDAESVSSRPRDQIGMACTGGSPGRIRTSDQPVNRGLVLQFHEFP
jgi:hypothetical protein